MGKPSEYAFNVATILKSATFDELVELGQIMCNAYAVGNVNTDTGVEWAEALNDMANSIIDRTEDATRPVTEIVPKDEPVDLEADKNGTGREKIIIDDLEGTVSENGRGLQDNGTGYVASPKTTGPWPGA